MNDPIRGCQVYKDIGCAHVDGFLCDYPNCSILKDYKMNKRIKELAEQAGSTHKQNLGVYQFYTDELEKFAELIVRECGDVAYRAFWADPDNVRGRHIEEKIKQHFGVEE